MWTRHLFDMGTRQRVDDCIVRYKSRRPGKDNRQSWAIAQWEFQQAYRGSQGGRDKGEMVWIYWAHKIKTDFGVEVEKKEVELFIHDEHCRFDRNSRIRKRLCDMEPNLQGLPIITILTSIVYTLSTTTTKSRNSELIQTSQFYKGQQVLPMIWYMQKDQSGHLHLMLCHMWANNHAFSPLRNRDSPTKHTNRVPQNPRDSKSFKSYSKAVH